MMDNGPTENETVKAPCAIPTAVFIPVIGKISTPMVKAEKHGQTVRSMMVNGKTEKPADKEL